MSFFGRLFGSEKALEAAVDGVTKGIDKLIYTEEEKANEAATERSEARKMVVGWMAATQGQNLSRRLISLSIAAVWLVQFVIATTLAVIVVFIEDKTTSQQVFEVIEVIRQGYSEMESPVMLILSFYFAAPYASDITKSILRRFDKKTKETIE